MAASASSSTGKSRSRSASERPGAAHPAPPRRASASTAAIQRDSAAASRRVRGPEASAGRRARRRAAPRRRRSMAPSSSRPSRRRARGQQLGARQLAGQGAEDRLARQRPQRRPRAARRARQAVVDSGDHQRRWAAVQSAPGRSPPVGTCGSSAAPITPGAVLEDVVSQLGDRAGHLGEETGALPQRRLDGPAAPAASDQQHERRQRQRDAGKLRAPPLQAPGLLVGAPGFGSGAPRRARRGDPDVGVAGGVAARASALPAWVRATPAASSCPPRSSSRASAHQAAATSSSAARAEQPAIGAA